MYPIVNPYRHFLQSCARLDNEHLADRVYRALYSFDNTENNKPETICKLFKTSIATQFAYRIAYVRNIVHIKIC